MKIQRHIGLPAGEMAIIPDTETLIHNIVTSELEQKDKEIDRLNNIIEKLEKSLKSHKDLKIKCHYKEYWVEVEEVLNFLQELKEGK